MKSCETSKESCIIDGRNVRLDLIKGVSCFLIVFLHNTLFTSGASISNSYDVVAVFLHTITRVAVPAFMGISGYFLLFYKERPIDYGLKSLVKYVIMLLVWETVYIGYGIITNGEEKSIGEYLSQVDITCGHLWYIKLLIVIMAVLPIIGCIVNNKRILRIYVIFWWVFFSIRFTLGIVGGLVPEINPVLKLFQLPYFEYHGYVGGTVGSEWPTMFMGPFIVIGSYIWLLEKQKIIDMWKKVIICLSLISYTLAAVVTVWYGIKATGFVDYLFQPVETHIVIMTMGYLALFYKIPDSFLINNVTLIKLVSECALGVYIMHPLVGSILRTLPAYTKILNSGSNVLLLNLFNWLSVCIISLLAAFLIKQSLPKRVNKYLM